MKTLTIALFGALVVLGAAGRDAPPQPSAIRDAPAAWIVIADAEPETKAFYEAYLKSKERT